MKTKRTFAERWAIGGLIGMWSIYLLAGFHVDLLQYGLTGWLALLWLIVLVGLLFRKDY